MVKAKIWNKDNQLINLIDNIVFLPLDLALIFIATFAGEYKTIYDIPVFIIAWLAIITVRRNFVISQVEILAQVIIFFSLLPIIIQFNRYTFDYYFWTICIILYVNVLAFASDVIERLLSNRIGTKFVILLPGISLIFLGLITQRLSGSSPRISFVFGPNVYYRIIAVVFFLYLALAHKNYSKIKGKISISSLLVTSLCLVSTLLIMVKTGSRGATIIGLLMILSFVYTLLKIKSLWLKLTSFVAILSMLGWFLINFILSSAADSRAFWFYDKGASSSSISERGGFWDNLPNFFLKDNYLFGEGSDYLYSYPHNIYLDLLYNGGFFPCLMLIIFSVLCGIYILQGKLQGSWKIIVIVFFPVFIGSFLSGTSYDNYSIVSLIFMLPIVIQHQVQVISNKKKKYLIRS